MHTSPDGDDQFAAASHKVRDLVTRRLFGSISLRDFNRELRSLNPLELASLTRLGLVSRLSFPTMRLLALRR